MLRVPPEGQLTSKASTVILLILNVVPRCHRPPAPETLSRLPCHPLAARAKSPKPEPRRRASEAAQRRSLRHGRRARARGRPRRSRPIARSATPSAPRSRSAAARPARRGARRRRDRGSAALRGAAALGAQPALRPAARDGRRAQELGGAEGSIGARRGEAARGARRGPSARVRELRGRDPGRQLRRGLGDRVGSGHLPLVQARGSAGAVRARTSWSWSCSGTSWAAAGRWCG